MESTERVSIRPNLDRYTRIKTEAGVKHDIGDDVALELREKTLEDIYAIVAETKNVTIESLKDKYGAKNPGMQRMCLGNILRGLRRKAALQ